MTSLKPREIINGLAKKGFRRVESRHTYLIFYFEGKKTSVRTMVSHGSKDIGDSLINKMASQVRLDKKKFLELVDCPLTEEGYLKELKVQGVLQT